MAATLTLPTSSPKTASEPSTSKSAPSFTAREALVHGSFKEGRGLKLVAAASCRMLHQVTEALVPVMIGVTVDKAIAPGNMAAMLWCVAGIVILFMVLTASWRYGTRLNTSVFCYGEHSLRQLLAAKVLHPLRSGRGVDPGRVLSISTSDTRHTAGLAWVVTEQMSALAALLTATVALVVISWYLAVIVLVATAIFMALMHLVTAPLERRAVAQQAAVAEATHVASDLVTGLRVLKGVGAVSGAAARYRAASRASLEAAIAMARAKALFTCVSLGLSSVFLAGIAWLSASMAANGSISVGQLVTVVGLAQFIKGPMTTLAFLSAEVREKRAVAGRLSTFLSEENDLDQDSSNHAPMELRDRSLKVRCADGAVVELDVSPGSITGVVGSSAATRKFLDVVAYRHPLSHGDFSIFGADAVDVGPVGVAQQVFVSEHESAVFSASVQENLATAQVDDSLVAAAGLDEVLQHLPVGLDSVIGEHGRTLSGGQRQRLLLSRALHQQQPVVVLHEPTSAVDSVTELRIAQSLRQLQGFALVVCTDSPALLNICSAVVDLAGPAADSVEQGKH